MCGAVETEQLQAVLAQLVSGETGGEIRFGKPIRLSGDSFVEEAQQQQRAELAKMLRPIGTAPAPRGGKPAGKPITDTSKPGKAVPRRQPKRKDI